MEHKKNIFHGHTDRARPWCEKADRISLVGRARMSVDQIDAADGAARPTPPILPDFTFPVVAFAPEAATGAPGDDGTREFLTPRDLTTTWFPETDLRLGWTFADVDGRCWACVSSWVIGRADAWWTRASPDWIHHPRYALALEFEPRPPMSFDAVKARLFAAVKANPQAHREYAGERFAQLRAAKSLADLIKSDEAWAIERHRPTPLWWRWLFWEGRASRRGFAAAAALLVLAWALLAALHFPRPAIVPVFLLGLLLACSMVVRRLHDLRRGGWWIAVWFAWSFLCAQVHDTGGDPRVQMLAVSAWWISTLCVLGLLAIWPGTPGPNRYGPECKST